MSTSSSVTESRLLFKLTDADDVKESVGVVGWEAIKPKSVIDVEVVGNADKAAMAKIIETLERNDYVFVRGVDDKKTPLPPTPPPTTGWSNAALISAALLGGACMKLFEPTVELIPFTATMLVAAIAVLLFRLSPTVAELASVAVVEAIAQRLVETVAVRIEGPVVSAYNLLPTLWAAVRNRLLPSRN